MHCLSIKRFLRSDRGDSTPVFVIGFPIVFFFFMAILELTFLMMRSTMLQRGLDITLREVRLGNMVNPNAATLEQAICNEISVFDDCTRSLTLEFTRVNTATFAMPAPLSPCVERTPAMMQARASDVYVTGAPNELMVVRACVLVDTITPYLGTFFDLTARSAFVNEPGD